MAGFMTIGDYFAGNAGAGQGPSYQPQTANQEQVVRDYLQQQKDEADRSYNLKKREVDNQYNIAKASAKSQKELQALTKWKNEQDVQLAQQRLAQEQQQFQARLEFDKVGQAQQFGLAQARQGYDLLGMQSQLRGANNYFQASELARNVAAQPGTATFLNALKNNTNLAGFGAQAGVPDKVSVDSLAARLGYTGNALVPGAGASTAATPNTDDQNLAAIRGIYQAGAGKLGAGSLERLTPTELQLLQSGIDASGGDIPTFMDQYKKSRIGQSYGNSAAA